MREGELLPLKWTDIDLMSGAIQVRRNRAKMVHGRADKDPKTRTRRQPMVGAACALRRRLLPPLSNIEHSN